MIIILVLVILAIIAGVIVLIENKDKNNH